MSTIWITRIWNIQCLSTRVLFTKTSTVELDLFLLREVVM